MSFDIFFYITAASALGLMLIFASDLTILRRALSGREITEKISESKPVFHGAYILLYLPMARFAKAVVMPKVFREIEIVISKTRLLFLRAERFLLGLTHYVRGKRKINDNGAGAHPYWDSLNGNKKNTDGDEEEKSGKDV